MSEHEDAVCCVPPAVVLFRTWKRAVDFLRRRGTLVPGVFSLYVRQGARSKVSMVRCLVACPCCGSCALRVVFSVFALFVSPLGASAPLLVGAHGGLLTRDLASQ